MIALPRATSWLFRRTQTSVISTVVSPLTVRCSDCGTGVFQLSRRFKSQQGSFPGIKNDIGMAQSQQANILSKVRNLIGGFVSFSAPKVPKGFENFMPRGKPSESPKPEESAKESPGSSSGNSSDGSPHISESQDKGGGAGGGGGGGAGKRGPGIGGNMPPNWQLHLGFALLVGAALMMNMQPSLGREINMQEFLSVVVESGKVDHLQVVNNRIVKVYLSGYSSGNNELEAALNRGRGTQASIPGSPSALPLPPANSRTGCAPWSSRGVPRAVRQPRIGHGRLLLHHRQRRGLRAQAGGRAGAASRVVPRPRGERSARRL
jgi:hypothetical protein